MNLLESHHIKLNKQQSEAVCTVDGQVLLLAVPGSGKTTVLVARLGYMIFEKKIRPEEILTITYTEAATHDMAARFRRFFPKADEIRPEFRTINGICAKIIKFGCDCMGRTSFALLDDEKKQAAILSEVFEAVEHSYPTESEIKDLRTAITYIKNMMLTEAEIEDLREDLGFDISKIYRLYKTEMRSRELMDYDDQMIYALNFLKSSPELLAHFRNRYRYLNVDEAQDTSKIQHEIIALLAGENGNLFMVGDEDQSIYGFRAAYPEALLYFEKRFPKAKVLLMEENYRSHPQIVEAADRFIQKNTLRHVKQMRAVRSAGKEETAISVRQMSSRKNQYRYLADVAREMEERGDMRKTAVLFRHNESVLPLVDLLDREGIPYTIRGRDLSFFSNKIIKDLYYIYRFAYDPCDTEAFMQIYYKLNLFMNKQQATRFCEESLKKGRSILVCALKSKQIPEYLIRNITRMQDNLQKILRVRADIAIEMIEEDLDYAGYLEGRKMDTKKLDIMKAIAESEPDLSHLFERLEELRILLSENQRTSGARLKLSTIHSSKGLEYDRVFIMDAFDGIFPEQIPVKRSKEELADYEEERRLFYVAATRAKEELVLLKLPQKTTFIEELTKGLEGIKMQAAGNEGISVGCRVEHMKYGEGVVTRMTVDKVEVNFGGVIKQFIPEIALQKHILHPLDPDGDGA